MKKKNSFKTSHNRRSFIKVSAATGGGMLIGFNLLTGCKSDPPAVAKPKVIPLPDPSQWFDINAYLKIGDTGLVSIISPNPEIGQNVKTSMPMIVAEELDVAWKDVVVEQSPLNSVDFDRQVAGGSQSIRQSWTALRQAGATAKKILVDTAAERWGIDASECSVSEGVITSPTGETLKYGELVAEASGREVPEEVELKDPSEFKIIGQSQVNVDMEGILSGTAVFGIDYRIEGMKHAVVLRPPAFGKELVSFDDAAAKNVNGVEQVLKFGNKIAVVANSTWAAMKGKKALTAEWKEVGPIEDSAYHTKTLKEHLVKKAEEARRVDGDVDAAFAQADEVIERIYEAPFLPHTCMEPMNFYANVTAEGAKLVGPIQTPKWTQSKVATLLGIEEDKVTVHMTRMGGGFGRRLYGDFADEAAEISSLIKAPVQVLFSREDDMTAGTYRPGSAYRFKVGIKDGQLSSYHLTEAFFNGEMFGNMPSNFPAGAIENYRVDCHNIESNITTGAWRAPYANFLASAEQSFFDELAEHLGKDPIDFRLELFAKAKEQPIGEEHNYEIDKFVNVIKMAREKSNWDTKKTGVHKGFSAYYSHNTYVAEVAEMVIENDLPVVKKVICAIDCGIVVNPKAAKNQAEGGVVDGLGHAMYGQFEIEGGRAKQTNFGVADYKLIRMMDAPEVEVHFAENQNDPTGLGEPTLPPAGGALSNALYAATGKRFYKQPFITEMEVKG